MKSETIMTFREFLDGAEYSRDIQEVQAEIANSELPFPAGTAGRNRRDRDWSLLANQIVGQENV